MLACSFTPTAGQAQTDPPVIITRPWTPPCNDGYLNNCQAPPLGTYVRSIGNIFTAPSSSGPLYLSRMTAWVNPPCALYEYPANCIDPEVDVLLRFTVHPAGQYSNWVRPGGNTLALLPSCYLITAESDWTSTAGTGWQEFTVDASSSNLLIPGFEYVLVLSYRHLPGDTTSGGVLVGGSSLGPDYLWTGPNIEYYCADAGQSCAPDRAEDCPNQPEMAFRIELSEVPPVTPQLKLELRANVTSGDDRDSYLPAGCPFDAAAEDWRDVCPRITVAARITPPSQAAGNAVRFFLDGTSTKYPGIAGNAEGPWLDATRTDQPDDYVLKDEGAAVPFDLLSSEALATLTVTDWGGSCTIRAVADTGETASLAIPLDGDSLDPPNGIADVSWVARNDSERIPEDPVWDLVEQFDPCKDVDATPVGAGVDGDGLSAWEEYRGFFVRGMHVRLNPKTKDYFYQLLDFPAEVSPAYVPQLNAAAHELRSPRELKSFAKETATGSRHFYYEINAYSPAMCPLGASIELPRQRAVTCRLWSLPTDPSSPIPAPLSGAELGRTAFECTPLRTSCVLDSYVFAVPVRLWTPPHHDDPLTEDYATDVVGWKVIASHEIGHGAGIVGDAPTNPGVHAYSYPLRPSDTAPPLGGPATSGSGLRDGLRHQHGAGRLLCGLVVVLVGASRLCVRAGTLRWQSPRTVLDKHACRLRLLGRQPSTTPLGVAMYERTPA